jgi:membrane protein
MENHQQTRLLHWHDIVGLLKKTGDAWMEDNATSLSASLAFYTVLSLVPFLIVITAIASALLGEKAAQGQLTWELQDVIGPTGAQALQDLIRSAQKSSTAETVLGGLTLLFGASAVVMELRDALNKIWHVKIAVGSSGIASFVRLVKERFYLFGLILGGGFLLVVSLALNAVVSGATQTFRPFLPIPPLLLHSVVFVVSFLVVTLLFAAVYKVVPEVQLTWRDVAVGACVTSLLFTIGKQLIGFYLGRAAYGSTYGAAGSILIVLVWVYYSAQLFFFGAEFTKVYAKKTHRHPPAVVDPGAPKDAPLLH